MSARRQKYLTLTSTERFVTEDCIQCGTLFAMAEDLFQQRLSDKKSFYCPRGHSMSYTGKTDEQKLRDAEAREVALRDQLEAAVRDAERTRAALLRDRQRFANGVCPCCNRTFQNVLRHMKGEHPDYDVTKVQQAAQPVFECSCGREFRTIGGLHQHQTKQRRPGWFKPTASRWAAHLTVV